MESTVEHPTTTWDAMPDGNVFYRRLQLYSIPGKFPDLNDYIIAGCRNGGPIGVCRANHHHPPCNRLTEIVQH